MTTNQKLEVFKRDLIRSLDADKTLNVLITVPTIAVRDYYLADPLFVNFYSGRVSFREKKMKTNNKMFFLVERV